MIFKSGFVSLDQQKLYNMILLPGQFRIRPSWLFPVKIKTLHYQAALISSIKLGKMHINGLLRLTDQTQSRGSANIHF